MLRDNITPENAIVGSYMTMSSRVKLGKMFVTKTHYLILEENRSQFENFNFINKPSKYTL